MPETRVAGLFNLLDRWRHFPAYKLEPRVDVFFALYLREVVEAHTSTRLCDIVIPELPIRRGALWGEGDKAPNMSVKVDYALLSRDGSVMYLLELKTDRGSRRDEQDAYLNRAAQLGLPAIVDGILAILLATESRYFAKYLHLLDALRCLGLIEVPADLPQFVFPSPRRGAKGALRRVRRLVEPPGPAVQVLYIQPEADSTNYCIGFKEFASVVLRHQDPVSQTFGAYLERWRTAAGAVLPARHAER